MNNISLFLLKSIKKLILLTLCFSPFMSTIASSTSVAKNINSSSLPRREIVLENDKVQVVRLTYPAGTESGMHTHKYAHRVVYFVKGGTLLLVPSDTEKPSKTLRVTDGSTLFYPHHAIM